jgi:hypothetical protein
MGLFSARERPELARSVQFKKVQESVRHVERSTNDNAAHLGSLLQRVTKTSLQQIDDIVTKLGRRREHLLSERARMQREIVEYAKLSQRTVQSTKVGTQHLLRLKKVPDAPTMSRLRVEDIFNEDRSESGVAASAQDNDPTLEGQEASAAIAAPCSEEETDCRASASKPPFA